MSRQDVLGVRFYVAVVALERSGKVALGMRELNNDVRLSDAADEGRHELPLAKLRVLRVSLHHAGFVDPHVEVAMDWLTRPLLMIHMPT